MLIIDPTSADFIDDNENDFPGGSGGGLRGNLSKKKKIGGKGGKGGRKDGEKGGRKKGTEGDLKGGKKKKGDGEDGKGKKGKKDGGKDDKRDKKSKGKSETGADKEGKSGKGRRTPQDDSAVAADERRMREEEERKRREAEEREEEKERQRRAREMKMAMEAELAAEREREAMEKRNAEDEAEGRSNRNRHYANEEEALEAEMLARLRKSKMAHRGGGKGDLSRSPSDADGKLADSRAELAEKRRRDMDEKLTWMTSHLGLSRQSCRFELPMDMRLLETMTPREYLSKYCVISSKRMLLYRRVFGKFVSKAHRPELRYEDVAAALREVHIHGISEEQMEAIMRLVDIESDAGCSRDAEKDTGSSRGQELLKSDVDFNFFAGIAALTERILYPIFSESKSSSVVAKLIENHETEPLEDTQQLSTFGTKEKLEKADFFCMPWKFDGVNVNPTVRKLLEVL